MLLKPQTADALTIVRAAFSVDNEAIKQKHRKTEDTAMTDIRLDKREIGKEELDMVSGGGPGCNVEKIRDKDMLSLSLEESKYIYYRMYVVRLTKDITETTKIICREFYRFGDHQLLVDFVAKWYPRKVKVQDFELKCKYEQFFYPS